MDSSEGGEGVSGVSKTVDGGEEEASDIEDGGWTDTKLEQRETWERRIRSGAIAALYVCTRVLVTGVRTLVT